MSSKVLFKSFALANWVPQPSVSSRSVYLLPSSHLTWKDSRGAGVLGGMVKSIVYPLLIRKVS